MVWLGKEAQTKVAQQGLAIPAVEGTADAIQDPILKEIAQQIERSEWLESPMDQVLGPDTGRVFNDVYRYCLRQYDTRERYQGD